MHISPTRPQRLVAVGQTLQLIQGGGKQLEFQLLGFLERYPLSRYRPDALLIRGDAIRAAGDEYEALFDYEEIARRYAGSDVFIPTLEREY